MVAFKKLAYSLDRMIL